MRLLFVIICLFLAISTCFAENLDDITYGEIYLAQPEHEVAQKLDYSVNYSMGLGVPEYKLHEVILATDYWLNDYFWVGLDLELAFAEKTFLQESLEQKLIQLGYGVKFEHPQLGTHLRFGAAIFSGLVNIMGQKVIPYELSIYGLGGLVRYKQVSSTSSTAAMDEKYWQGTSFGFGFDQRFLLKENYGIIFGLSALFENGDNGNKSEVREQFKIGMYGRF